MNKKTIKYKILFFGINNSSFSATCLRNLLIIDNIELLGVLSSKCNRFRNLKNRKFSLLKKLFTDVTIIEIVTHFLRDIFNKVIFLKTCVGIKILNKFLNLKNLCYSNNIQYYSVDSVNLINSIELIMNLSPDFIIVGSFSEILMQKVINIPKMGIYNVHPGKLPEYKGANPIENAVYNREKIVTCTIHKINRAIDAGNIICEKKLLLEDAISIYTFRKYINDLIGDCLNDFAENIYDELYLNGWKQQSNICFFSERIKGLKRYKIYLNVL